jgi:hypothetical protein
MKRLKSLKLLAFVLIGASFAYGQATRTWVSGVGDDANPCSRTAPCKTFAGAISKTAAGGEIDALDPGGFGALTITKAITLDGGGGQVASVLVAGTNGIVVAAGAGDIVIIRNLRFDGLLGGGNTNAGLDGIKFISGKDLNIENVYVFGFAQNCIEAALNQNSIATMHIINSVTKNCGADGIKAVNAQVPAVEVGIDHTSVMVSGVNGIESGQHSHVLVNNSSIEHATQNGLLTGDATTSDGVMTVDNSDISFNVNGVSAAQGGTLSIGTSKVAFNRGCGYNSANSNVFAFTHASQGTNRLVANSVDTCGTVNTVPEK